ncbi:MAG TPA: hypothetical protein VNM36_03390 [Gemmatimonadaceae bacterium]|nr:hypothetical protein [Gemmatimonadaceae bacterium]
MPRHVFASLGFALLGACAHANSQRAPVAVFPSASSALDCAQAALRDKGFDVQGLDVGAGNYFGNAPVRNEYGLRARQESAATDTRAYVNVAASLADSTPTYTLSVIGWATSLDGTSKSDVLNEGGVSAVVSKCGATRSWRW